MLCNVRESFPGYYRPTDQELRALWSTGLIIVDTNILLNLYRFPSKARHDFLAVLEQVAPRLWIPHQVAWEFQVNRLRVISEEIKKFEEVKASCEKAIVTFENRLPKRHATINPAPFLDRFRTLIDDFLRELAVLRSAQPTVSSDDALRTRLDTLLAGRVGQGFTSQEELDRLYAEGKGRYERKFPPGYQDQSKAGKDPGSRVQTHNGLIMREEYGDLIAWLQMIEEAGRRKAEGVLFVTDDEKEDWWRIHERKTVGPRVELVEEMRHKAGVSLFYMYNAERFLTFARNYLGARIDESSIDEVRATREELQEGQYVAERRVPVTLSQILAVIDAFDRNGKDFQEAISRVAFDRGISKQTVVDKCTRRLRLTTSDFRQLLDEPAELREMLMMRFPGHEKLIWGRLSGLPESCMEAELAESEG